MINRQYKDRLFKRIFRDKKDLLELYNAMNDTNYSNPEEIEVNTLEDVVYMGMKNDVSFIFTEVLNPYEHQSTFNPNLPLRGLLYFAKLYQKIIGPRKDLYSEKLINLPYPQFIVFYNGTKEEPEQQILELSAAFPKEYSKENAALQCRAVVLNINLGYNKKVMERCKKLKEYAQFIAKIREYLEEKENIEEAVDLAIDECIHHGILEDILREDREEVRSMLLTEYDEQVHIKNEKEISYEEGERAGIIKGEQVGIKKGEDMLSTLIQHLLAAERMDDIVRVTTDTQYRQKLYKEFQLIE